MSSPVAATACPRVSVILPTHNRAVMVEETVRNILSQTMTDFELIVVCNGCTDDTAARMAAIGDSRIRILERSNSGRPAHPRNDGMRAARGHFLAFCDDDDLWEREKLAVQIAALESRPDIALCANSEYWFDGTKRWLVDPQPRTTFRGLLRRNTISTSAVVIRADVAQETGFFDESPELRAVEDCEYWLRIAYRHPIIHLRQPLSWYRVHPGGISADRVVMQRRRIAMLDTLRRKLGWSFTIWSMLMLCRSKYLVLRILVKLDALGLTGGSAGRQTRKA